MAYTPTYTADDIAPSVIDVGLTIWLSVGIFAVIFGLLLAYRFGTNVARGKKLLS